MTAPNDPAPAPEDIVAGFDEAQQRILESLGQALIAQSTGGTVALELVSAPLTAAPSEQDVRLTLERQSGLTVPTAPEAAVTEAVQRLALLWQEHGRTPWRSFTYHLTRGEHGPRFTCEFDV